MQITWLGGLGFLQLVADCLDVVIILHKQAPQVHPPCLHCKQEASVRTQNLARGDILVRPSSKVEQVQLVSKCLNMLFLFKSRYHLKLVAHVHSAFLVTSPENFMSNVIPINFEEICYFRNITKKKALTSLCFFCKFGNKSK